MTWEKNKNQKGTDLWKGEQIYRRIWCRFLVSNKFSWFEVSINDFLFCAHKWIVIHSHIALTIIRLYINQTTIHLYFYGNSNWCWEQKFNHHHHTVNAQSKFQSKSRSQNCRSLSISSSSSLNTDWVEYNNSLAMPCYTFFHSICQPNRCVVSNDAHLCDRACLCN